MYVAEGPKQPAAVLTKEMSFHYHVRLGDGFTVTVGKKTFCDIHAVGKRRVEALSCKLGTGELLYRDGPGVASFVVYLRES